jgi:hypothetical protein
MNRENQAGNAAIIAGFLMNLGQDLAISGRMVLVERKIGFIRSLAP